MDSNLESPITRLVLEYYTRSSEDGGRTGFLVTGAQDQQVFRLSPGCLLAEKGKRPVVASDSNGSMGQVERGSRPASGSSEALKEKEKCGESSNIVEEARKLASRPSSAMAVSSQSEMAATSMLVECGSHVRPLVPSGRSLPAKGTVVEQSSHVAGDKAPTRLLVRKPLVQEAPQGWTDGHSKVGTEMKGRDGRSQGTLGRGSTRYGVDVWLARSQNKSDMGGAQSKVILDNVRKLGDTNARSSEVCMATCVPKRGGKSHEKNAGPDFVDPLSLESGPRYMVDPDQVPMDDTRSLDPIFCVKWAQYGPNVVS